MLFVQDVGMPLRRSGTKGTLVHPLGTRTQSCGLIAFYGSNPRCLLTADNSVTPNKVIF